MRKRHHSACAEREGADDEGGRIHEHEGRETRNLLGRNGAIVVAVVVMSDLGAQTTQVDEDAAIDYYKGAFDYEEPHVVIDQAFAFVFLIDPALSQSSISKVYNLRCTRPYLPKLRIGRG